MVHINFLSIGLYSLKNSHIPFGMGFQPPPPYGRIPFEQHFSYAVASLTTLNTVWKSFIKELLQTTSNKSRSSKAPFGHFSWPVKFVQKQVNLFSAVAESQGNSDLPWTRKLGKIIWLHCLTHIICGSVLFLKAGWQHLSRFPTEWLRNVEHLSHFELQKKLIVAIFLGSDGPVRTSPPSRSQWTGKEEMEVVEDRRGETRGNRRGDGEEVDPPERDLASPDLISRVQSRPPRQSRKSPGET